MLQPAPEGYGKLKTRVQPGNPSLMAKAAFLLGV